MAARAADDWRALAIAAAENHGPWRLPTEPPTRLQRMLALAARVQLSEEDAAQIRVLGQDFSDDDWLRLFILADDERLPSLVYAQIAAAGMLPALPQAVATRFATDYQQTLSINLRMRTTLERLLDQFANASIAVLPLKGVVLVERLYGNLAWRRTGDIDLLVRREDIDRARQVVERAGYYSDINQGDVSAFRAIAATETHYRNPKGLILELHWGLSKRPDYRLRLRDDAIWQRAQTETWRGRAIPVMTHGDELRYLAIHCTADHLAMDRPLRWLVDVAEMARRPPAGWRWDDFAAETIAAGLATPVALALAQCRAVLDVDVPEEPLTAMLRAALAPRERVAWRSAWAPFLSREWIAANLRALPTRRERAVFALRAWTRAAANASHLRSIE
jgi:Uncharacterised nucleotidyltransferase